MKRGASACTAALVASAVAFATASAARAQEAAPGRALGDYRVVELAHPERTLAHRTVDVDGDGRRDLVFAFERDASGEHFGLRTCTFAPEPAFSRCTDLALGEDVRAFDVGNVDATPASELVLLTRGGGALAAWRDGRFAPPQPLALDSLLAGSDDGAPVAARVLFDLDGDGRDELLLPTLAGPALRRFTDAGPGAAQTLASPAQVRYRLGRRASELAAATGREPARRLASEATTPLLYVEDFDGDARLDVVTITDNRVRVFAQREDGAFPSTPTLDVERSVLSPEAEREGFRGEATSFADLDGDGRADLIVLEWGADGERTKMDRHVFFAREGLAYPEEPDQIVRSESVFPDFEIADLDGDGRRDLVIPYFHIAPSQALKMVTQNTLRVQLRMFLLREDGRFGQDEGNRFARVDRRIVLDYHLDVMRFLFGAGGRPPEHFAPLITTRGDFDGDGLRDLATDDGRGQLHIRFGNRDADFSRGPELAIRFESSLAHELVDVDGDGRSDVVSYLGRASDDEDDEDDDGRSPTELRRGTRPARAPAPTTAPAAPPAASRIHVLLSR